ncbi:MAG: amidohydrolase family protein [Vicinamibacteria bacterium]|nr:amidohydrolase family protein [Vicinamibacteria bacterium]
MRSVFLLFLAIAAAQPAGRVLVLEHARLVDGTGRPPIDDARIVIEGERISAVGPAASVPAPAGAERVDLSGRTVLPGLVDAHFHLDNSPPDPKLALRQLANGVTSFRDPGQWDEYYAGLRATIAADGLRGPRIHTAGPHIDGEGPAYPRDSVVARDATEARQFAERAIAQGATAIKIYFRLPLGSAKAVIDVCRERRVISTAHLELLEAAELFTYGLDGIEHITSLGPSLLPQLERERYRQAVLAENAARGPGRYAAFAGLDLDSGDARALWAVIGQRRPFIDATLAVFERRPAVPADPKDTPELIATRARGFQKMLATTRRAFEAGGRVVMGGHSSVPFAGRGEAPWREMELLVDAGLTPMQAIEAATASGAAFLGRARDLGTVEPGKLADLIVLTGNPVSQIAEIRTVERVLAGGAWVDVGKYRKD